MNKTIYIVATPIGNLGDLSFRALEVLKSVDYILAEDTRRTRILLDHYGVKTMVMSFHKHNEKGRLADIEKMFSEYSKIALVSDAGTPLVSDPGDVLVEYAMSNHISLVPIPGPSALTTLLSVSGVSAQGSDLKFIGFMPHTENAIRKKVRELISNEDVFVFFDSPQRIRRTVKIISEFDPNAQVVIGRELTKVHEEILRFRASSAPLDIMDKGEFTVLVSPEKKKAKRINVSDPGFDSKSETKKLSIQLANYLNLEIKDAYKLLIELKEEYSLKE